MTDQASEGLLSPLLRKGRIRATLPYLHGRVLDVGCGSGALANHVAPGNYTGVEIDEESLAICRHTHPEHSFLIELPPPTERFDTIISLAVIEHVKAPDIFLQELAVRLEDSPESGILISTPHPAMDWVHTLGSSVGLFSQHASDEHEELLDKSALRSLADAAGLALVDYRRFMLGANQLALYRRKPAP